MPKLARWAVRAALLYLVAGLATGALYWANQQWSFSPLFAALNPIYVHLLVVGWLTQLIFGVMYWMFPIISKANMRGDSRLAWSVFVLLNIGLILRTICEPWRVLDANTINGLGLVVSAVLQAVSAYLFVIVCWPRVRERGGS